MQQAADTVKRLFCVCHLVNPARLGIICGPRGPHEPFIRHIARATSARQRGRHQQEARI